MKIWKAVDEFRGQKKVSDLKEILVSIIFLKFSNDQYDKNQVNIIQVPKEASFEFLKRESSNSSFYNSLIKAFKSLELANTKLKDTFTVFNFERKFINNGDLEVLQKLFVEISEINIIDNIAYQDLIGNLLLNFSKSEGLLGGDYTTPISVSKLMIKLLDPSGGKVLDSVCGTGGFYDLIEKSFPERDYTFYGQEVNSSILALAKLRFAFNNKNRFQFSKAEDTLINDQFPNLEVDNVIMNPPFNLKSWRKNNQDSDPRFSYGIPPNANANLAWIQHATYHLNSKGKAIVLMSNSSLTSTLESDIRKNLVNDNLIEAIIDLPSQLFTNTGISTSLWLLNKNKANNDEILFVDASSFGQMSKVLQRNLSDKDIIELSTLLKSWQQNDLSYSDKVGLNKSVGLSEIRENNYHLSPNRYIGIEHLNDIDLGQAVILNDILEYSKPKKLNPDVSYKKLSIKDLSSNPDSYILDTYKLEEGKLNRDYKCLDTGLLLIARFGSQIKHTYYDESNHKIAFSSNLIYSFKVNLKKVRLDYLLGELHKEYVKAQIANFTKGTSIPFIKLKDFLDVKIVLPSIEEQKTIIQEERELRFQSAAKDLGFEKEIERLKKAQIKDLGSKKHNIMQHLNNVKSSVDVLTKMMSLNNGILKADQIIDPRRGVSVENRFSRLQESLGKVIYFVDNITNESNFEKAEVIDAAKFLDECRERGIQHELFSVELMTDYETFDNKKPLISISKNDFEELYTNILENARIHGFIDNSKKYIFRVTVAYIDDFVEILFENNGKSFPKGISDRIDIKGEKAGVTAGTGIGLWKVFEIVKHFGGAIEVLDNPEEDFPVGFKIKFNLEIA